MAENVVVTGHKVIGLNINVAQGDNKKTFYYPGLDAADYDDMKTAIEASGEWTVLGFGPVYRLETAISGALTIVEGTTDETKFVKCGVRRTVDIGGTDVDMKTLYIPLPISINETKAQNVKAALQNKVIGGAKVTDVFRQSATSIGTSA